MRNPSPSGSFAEIPQRRTFCWRSLEALQRLDVGCLPAFRALYNVELYSLSFLQALETVRTDRRVMHEDILAILARDEAVALGVVKPLYCSLFHLVPFPKF